MIAAFLLCYYGDVAAATAAAYVSHFYIRIGYVDSAIISNGMFGKADHSPHNISISFLDALVCE